jgi:polar amino acid transport system substrate-binding protein
MRKAGMRSTVCFILLTLCWVSPAQPTLKIAVGEWPPFNGKALEDQGTLTKLMVDLLEEAGYRAEIEWYPWKRAYHLAETGQADITGVWTLKPDRCEIFHCSTPVINLRNVLFKRTDLDAKVESWADLKEYNVGVTIGYSYLEMRDAAEEHQIPLFETRTDLLNLRKLLMGHIDFFLCNPEVGTYLIENNFTVMESRQIEYLEQPAEVLTMGILVSKNIPYSRDIINNINRVIAKWYEDGRLPFQSKNQSQP